MSAAMLPALPRSAEFIFREINRDRGLEPLSQGNETVIQRIGTKHEIEISRLTLSTVGCGPELTAALALAKSAGALMPIPEPGMPNIPFGLPLVNGGSQLGSTLIVDGLTPQCVIPCGKWLSVIVNGRRYAYYCTADVIADAGGAATIPIYPMIRRSPADGDVVELSTPMIEGLVKMAPDRSVRRVGAMTVAFTIRERG